MKDTKVLFLLPYPLKRAPSQRFRVEALLPLLDQQGIRYTLKPFMDEETWSILYKPGSILRKAWGVAKGFLRRTKHVLIDSISHDYIFIQREASPIGPPVFEWCLKFLYGKKIIYDFDDAIWIPSVSDSNWLASKIKAAWKIKYLCRWAYKVSAGNKYLGEFAASSGAKRVEIIPTVVDTSGKYSRTKVHGAGPVTIGWTGSHSTLKYLNEFVPIYNKLHSKYDLSFVVIADKNPELAVPGFRYIPWSESSEIDSMLQMDIGIMPLTRDPWSEGKCGFKIIQYLALGIPAVASPVGVNSIIIDKSGGGFLAPKANEWEEALTKLIEHPELRTKTGEDGKNYIENFFSKNSLSSSFPGLFSS